jgi:hypothetical protein
VTKPALVRSLEAPIPLSTTLSHLGLMFAAFAGTVLLRRRGERYVSTGLLLIGIAAFIGALRYSINPGLTELYTFVTTLAACTGLPLIAVQYASTQLGWPGRDGRMNTMGASVVGFALFGLAFPLPLYAHLVAGASLLAIAGCALRTVSSAPRRSGLAVLGALVVLFAGTAVGRVGVLGPFPRLDVFNALCTGAVLAIAAGLPYRRPDW